MFGERNQARAAYCVVPFIWHTGKANNSDRKKSGCQGLWVEEVDGGQCGDGKTILYLDFGSGSLDVWFIQTQNYISKRVNFTKCKLHLKLKKNLNGTIEEISHKKQAKKKKWYFQCWVVSSWRSIILSSGFARKFPPWKVKMTASTEQTSWARILLSLPYDFWASSPSKTAWKVRLQTQFSLPRCPFSPYFSSH